MADEGRSLPNPYLSSLSGDYLYHLGYSRHEAENGFTTTSRHEAENGSTTTSQHEAENGSTTTTEVSHTFSDVKFVVMGGSSDRMKAFAEFIAKEMNHAVQNVKQLDITRTDRFVLYKIGPILSVSHGMGVPSISILLHEMTKLLSYAGAKDAIFIRIGTSGGIGVTPGTVVVANKTFNGFLKEEHEIVILGERKTRPAVLNQELATAIQGCHSDPSYQVVLGGTMCTDDFFEGQGRVDGAVCEHTETQKMEFLKKAQDCGVVNIEMECAAMAALCNKSGYKCAIVCVALLDRLQGDQVKIPPEQYKAFGVRPQSLIVNFIKTQLKTS